jgi:hypothetical protein
MGKIELTASEKMKYDTIRSCSEKDITNKQAAHRLNLKIRQVQRLKRTYEKDGELGIVHGLKGGTAHNATDKETTKKIVNFFKEKKHKDFGPTFAQEKLVDVKTSRETLRSIMIKNDLWKAKTRRGPGIHRQWRERMDSYGELVQFDGSYHDWFENGKEQCLLASIDDATSNIIKAVFEDNEGVRAVFRFWWSYIEARGLPVAIYLDKFSTYKVNHKNAVDNVEFITQFERAMKTLGIRVICANSPEAKGRVERLFGTLQNRLVKEMRLDDVRCIDEANIFLKKTYIKDHNKRFSVVPKNACDAHRNLTDDIKKKLSSIFSLHYARKVNNDFTIQFKTKWFQLSATQKTTIYKDDTVKVEEHLDDTIHIFKNDIPLNYILLPERPVTVRIKVTALTREKPKWIPPVNHPWRNSF